jgi:N-acetylglucosaminyl-diphospho-decaprenol L-rhamnosyltransferase
MTVLSVDVVVVAYNSRDRLRSCIEPFVGVTGITPIVVDNACPERSYEVVEGLPGVQVVHMPMNGGFAYGCNGGWRAGRSEYVLFLNPDAVVLPGDLARLAAELDDPAVGVVGPKTLDEDGHIDWTIRRFPSLVSTYAQAVFLHRLAPRAHWVDEVVREAEAYERHAEVDWLSGSCLLVRRTTLETVHGLDEEFFFYSEDIDLCRRVQKVAGLAVRFCPDAVCVHAGGVSRPRAQLLPMLASSRLRYARRHRGRLAAALERIGIGVGEALRSVVGRGDRTYRRGHRKALVVVLRGNDAYRPS